MAIKPADFVRLNYRATFSNGWSASNDGQEPIEIVQGDSGMPGVDAAILGYDQGETLKFMVPAADAFGVRDESALYDIPMADFVTDVGMRPVVGCQVSGSDPDGTPFAAFVVEVTDDYARCDPNHPLAGLDVTWDITIVEAVGGMKALWRALRSDIKDSGSMQAFWRTFSADMKRTDVQA